jgi:hypothetical protein
VLLEQQEITEREDVSAWSGGLGLLMTDIVQVPPTLPPPLTPLQYGYPFSIQQYIHVIVLTDTRISLARFKVRIDPTTTA